MMTVMLSSSLRVADESRAVKEELARIEGTWQLVYAETDGKTAPAERIQSVRVEIKQNSHSVYFGDKEVAHDISFTIDPTAMPRTTDDTINEGPDKGKQIHGIYELEGDTLASCVAKVGQERPSKFSTAPSSGHSLRVFKRVRPDEGPKEKAIRADLIRFGGTWRFVELEIGGIEIPPGNFVVNRLFLQGDRFLATNEKETTAGYYKIDPTRVPKTIDLVFTSGSAKGATTRGIYELTDDTYRTCFSVDNQPRPEKFETKPGTNNALELLKKERP